MCFNAGFSITTLEYEKLILLLSGNLLQFANLKMA